jgi:hypothetical protein
VVFVDIEAPLPVVMVEEPCGSGAALSDDVPSAAGLSDAGARSGADLSDSGWSEAGSSDVHSSEAGVGDAYDAALSSVRTTNPSPAPAGKRDERTLLMGDERTLLMGDARTLLVMEPPTRLALDSRFLKREGNSASQAPASRSGVPRSGPVRAASKARPGDEERTHLLLDSFDLKDERETPFSRMTARLRPFAERALELGRSVEQRLHGRWRVAFATLGVACGILPPIFDYLTDDPGSSAGRVASVAVLFTGVAFALAWLGKLRQDDGTWDWKVAGVRLQTTARRLIEDLQDLPRSPRYLLPLSVGELLVALGVGGSSLVACRSIVRLLLGHTDPPSLLRFVSGVVLVGGVLALRAAQRGAPKAAPGPLELGESLAAARHLPPILDLSEPLPTSIVGEDTPLHRIVFALSQWRDRECLDEAGYRAALERHLQRHLPTARVERERWFGRSRHDGVADIIVGDLVLIQVNQGFRQRSAERVIAAMKQNARTWPGKPMILTIFGASREVVFESPGTAALIDLHQALPMLTVRMPPRR